MSLSQAYASTTGGSASGFVVAMRSLRSTVGKTLEQRRVRARARHELEAYSDRQLMDLGVSRSDIPSIVDGTFAR